jgi:hypothetical protein
MDLQHLKNILVKDIIHHQMTAAGNPHTQAPAKKHLGLYHHTMLLGARVI